MVRGQSYVLLNVNIENDQVDSCRKVIDAGR